jgi:RNA polymerase sigma factor (sigma-70 family)
MVEWSPARSSSEREALFTKLHARILGFATNLRCGDDAKDIAQETMLELTRRYGEIQSAEELIKIANVICFNKVRNLRKRRPIAISVDDSQQVYPGPGPEVLVLDQELHERLLSTLQRSSPRCRALFLLDLREADTETICGELNVTRSALYALRSRCSTECRKVLRRQ